MGGGSDVRWLESSPWIAGGLRITRSAMAEVERHAIAGYLADEEACGTLAGPADEPLLCDRAARIENIAKALHDRDPVAFFHTARTFFAFHERTLERAMSDGLREGSPIKVLYHSHLDTGAHLSATDAAVLSGGRAPGFAGGRAMLGAGPPWPLAFMVTSVLAADGTPYVADHRLYIWGDGGFEPASFEQVADALL